MLEQREIVGGGLAETEARIHRQAGGSMPASRQARDARGQEIARLRRPRRRSCGASCIVRGSPRMCMRQMPAPGRPQRLERAGLGERAHVIDDVGAGVAPPPA